jgi:hypothetical protein
MDQPQYYQYVTILLTEHGRRGVARSGVNSREGVLDNPNESFAVTLGLWTMMRSPNLEDPRP